MTVTGPDFLTQPIPFADPDGYTITVHDKA